MGDSRYDVRWHLLMIEAGADATTDMLGRLMATGRYERLTRSRAGTTFKALVRTCAPATAERVQRAVHAARRAWQEPPQALLSADQQLWNPPPRRIRERPARPGEVTETLFARLSDADVVAMLDRLGEAEREQWERTDEVSRQMLAIHLCLHHGVPGVSEKTGLTVADPPDDVTAMGRGALAAGGSVYYADMVAESLRRGGTELVSKQRVLDFGCSSGRIVRVLAAVYPGVEWSACDPDAKAVGWAAENLPGVTFFTNSVEPPLPFPDGHFDAAYAIGIWTHYSEAAALRWLEEMRRIIELGGHLVLTSHGYQSVELHGGEWGNWPPERIAETVTRLYTDGHKFFGGYGKGLSLAQGTPDWGEAFFTPEWLAEHACPQWAIVAYEPGRVENNHDLYVLERRG